MKWLIYTKDYCPYCDLAKTLIRDLGYEYREIDLSDDYEALQELFAKTRMRSVPQIFSDDNFIGGYSDLRSAVDNKLIIRHSPLTDKSIRE